MTARESQVKVAELEDKLTRTLERVTALETTLSNVVKRLPKATPGRWLAGAKYGKACAGGCGARVEPGERAWYEKDNASVYCVGCGTAREAAEANGMPVAA